jgi:autotransporter-associated beta strand protein
MGGGQALPSAAITVRDTATLSSGAAALDLLNTTTAASSATLNLDGGTTTVGAFVKTSVGATQTAVLNFNGGTLKFGGTTANASFLPALAGLTANVKSGGARIDDNAQAITITEPLLHDPALATVDGGLTKLGGAGTLTLAAANTYTGPTTVNAGTLKVTGSIAASAGVTVNTGGILDVAATQTVKSLTLTGGHADLHDNTLVINYDPASSSPRTSIRAALAAGMLGSSSLTPTTAIAYAEAAELLTFTNGLASYAGQTVDPTSLLLRRTIAGDANLDQKTDFNDLVQLAQNYNTTGRFWSDGDFTYDGAVDFNDLVVLAQNYSGSFAAAVPSAPAAFDADLAAAFAIVPEPTTAALALAACGFALLPRRRRPVL